MTKAVRTLTVAAGMWMLSVNRAFACPVCFGAADSPLVQGSTWAILSLLGVTVGVLGAFATFFLHLRKRAKLFAEKGSGGISDSATSMVPRSGRI